MQILQARWNGEYPRNTETEPAWDTELRDDGNWLDPSSGFIMLPDGDYLAVFSGICQENLSSINNRIYAYFGISPMAGFVYTRYREDRAAGVLAPDFNISGFVQIDTGAEDAIWFNPRCLYANTSDVDWLFDITVMKLN